MALSIKDGKLTTTINKVVKQSDRSITCGLRITGTKNKNGTWRNVNCFGRFVGEAFDRIQGVEEGTIITTDSFSVDTYVGQDGKPYLNLTIYKVHLKSDTFEVDSSELPF